MQLTRCTPRHKFGYHHNLFPGLRDDFFSSLINNNAQTNSTFVPTVDIYEKDNTIFLEAELPGFDKNDLNVDIEGKIITLSGERKEEDPEGENRYRQERRYGKFERSFRLGFEADSSTIKARYENGILTVEVPKPAEQEVKQIKIH